MRLIALSLAMLPLHAVAADYTFTAYPDSTYQTIVDFGASDCWTAEYVGSYFNDEEKEKAARWLFSRDFDKHGNPLGIGLSMWRVNLGAGSAEQGEDSGIKDPTRRGLCYMDADGQYDWTKCAGQQWFMEKAKRYGVEHMLLFANSAPVYFTKNGKACADKGVEGSNLREDCYERYADYLTRIAQHFITHGYNITHIDPLNEPQYDWTEGQEGTPMKRHCIARLARILDNDITEAGINAKILIPEACQYKALYTGGTEKRANDLIEAFFNPDRAATYVGDLQNLEKAVAGHSYWTHTTNEELRRVRQTLAEKARQYGVDVYQTEWSMLGDAPSAEAAFPASYDAATYMDMSLYMSKIIHCDLTYANARTWHYWTSFSQEQYHHKNRFYLLRLMADGDKGTGMTGNESYGSITRGGSISDNTNLWALGQYSRFIRPGYQRIALHGDREEDLNGLLGSAYLSPDGRRVVMVYVNMSGSDATVDMSVSGMKSPANVEAYLTNASCSMKRIHCKSKAMMPNATVTVPARSIETFVVDWTL